VLGPRLHADHFVSIHARARRATFTTPEEGSAIEFQSTPARGGRHNDAQELTPGDRVSIHARARRATGKTPCGSVCVIVSIHARARRATGHTDELNPLWNSFNPRPRAAGDVLSTVPCSRSW